MVITKAYFILSWEGKRPLLPCVRELYRRDTTTTSQTARCGGQSKHSLQASEIFFSVLLRTVYSRHSVIGTENR